MVVGETQKPLHIFSRPGSRPVPDGLYVGISHFHTLEADLPSQELYSPREQGTLFRLELQMEFLEAGNTLRRLAR